MSWICDYCGYENEYMDSSQPYLCRCCGEPGNEDKPFQAIEDIEIKVLPTEEWAKSLSEIIDQSMKTFKKLLP